MSALTPADSKMFGRLWWAQPLPARYASIDAASVGLSVQIEVCNRGLNLDDTVRHRITWRGTAEQFGATKTFPKGVSAKLSSGRFVYPGQLRGTVYPGGIGHYVFVIEFCYLRSKIWARREAKAALADESYLDFRDAVMAGFPLADVSGDDVRILSGGLR
ncbi:hypothetical protein [Massilia rubra]|uniref:Uncharacterized protein n=1 Tax=Massilia rubra TaxID=2607910 RepID=A0ABX0M424_9BURK|nr:hypothetical protein [Massilia rubra]NHZ38359.1 hypothetical protein [Massilia rubra]